MILEDEEHNGKIKGKGYDGKEKIIIIND